VSKPKTSLRIIKLAAAMSKSKPPCAECSTKSISQNLTKAGPEMAAGGVEDRCLAERKRHQQLAFLQWDVR
jgi:hypothetical protein